MTPAFRFAVLLWEPVRRRYQELIASDKSPYDAMVMAGGGVLSAQQPLVTIPKRFGLPMREIWELQPRLEQRQGKRPHRLATHPRFRAAYDFLVLRAESATLLDVCTTRERELYWFSASLCRGAAGCMASCWNALPWQWILCSLI